MDKRSMWNSGKMKSVLLATLLILVSTSVMASEGGHADSGVLLKDFLWRCLNFGVLIALLGYFVTKPIKKGLAGRTESIEKSLTEAREAQQAAEAKFAEYDEKLAKASAEIDDIYASIKREGELERDRIVKGAQEMAAKIEKEAQKSAEVEVAKAKAALQDKAVNLAIEIAEDILKKNFTTEDHSRLVDEYMQKVGELH
jgi:F-type H+-transporting ATPase subunit b